MNFVILLILVAAKNTLFAKVAFKNQLRMQSEENQGTNKSPEVSEENENTKERDLNLSDLSANHHEFSHFEEVENQKNDADNNYMENSRNDREEIQSDKPGSKKVIETKPNLISSLIDPQRDDLKDDAKASNGLEGFQEEICKFLDWTQQKELSHEDEVALKKIHELYSEYVLKCSNYNQNKTHVPASQSDDRKCEGTIKNDECVKEEPCEGTIKNDECVKEQSCEGTIKNGECVKEEPCEGTIKNDECFKEQSCEGTIKTGECVKEEPCEGTIKNGEFVKEELCEGTIKNGECVKEEPCDGYVKDGICNVINPNICEGRIVNGECIVDKIVYDCPGKVVNGECLVETVILKCEGEMVEGQCVMIDKKERQEERNNRENENLCKNENCSSEVKSLSEQKTVEKQQPSHGSFMIPNYHMHEQRCRQLLSSNLCISQNRNDCMRDCLANQFVSTSFLVDKRKYSNDRSAISNSSNRSYFIPKKASDVCRNGINNRECREIGPPILEKKEHEKLFLQAKYTNPIYKNKISADIATIKVNTNSPNKLQSNQLRPAPSFFRKNSPQKGDYSNRKQVKVVSRYLGKKLDGKVRSNNMAAPLNALIPLSNHPASTRLIQNQVLGKNNKIGTTLNLYGNNLQNLKKTADINRFYHANKKTGPRENSHFNNKIFDLNRSPPYRKPNKCNHSRCIDMKSDLKESLKNFKIVNTNVPMIVNQRDTVKSIKSGQMRRVAQPKNPSIRNTNNVIRDLKYKIPTKNANASLVYNLFNQVNSHPRFIGNNQSSKPILHFNIQPVKSQPNLTPLKTKLPIKLNNITDNKNLNPRPAIISTRFVTLFVTRTVSQNQKPMSRSTDNFITYPLMSQKMVPIKSPIIYQTYTNVLTQTLSRNLFNIKTVNKILPSPIFPQKPPVSELRRKNLTPPSSELSNLHVKTKDIDNSSNFSLSSGYDFILPYKTIENSEMLNTADLHLAQELADEYDVTEIRGAASERYVDGNTEIKNQLDESKYVKVSSVSNNHVHPEISNVSSSTYLIKDEKEQSDSKAFKNVVKSKLKNNSSDSGKSDELVALLKLLSKIKDKYPKADNYSRDKVAADSTSEDVYRLIDGSSISASDKVVSIQTVNTEHVKSTTVDTKEASIVNKAVLEVPTESKLKTAIIEVTSPQTTQADFTNQTWQNNHSNLVGFIDFDPINDPPCDLRNTKETGNFKRQIDEDAKEQNITISIPTELENLKKGTASLNKLTSTLGNSKSKQIFTNSINNPISTREELANSTSVTALADKNYSSSISSEIHEIKKLLLAMEKNDRNMIGSKAFDKIRSSSDSSAPTKTTFMQNKKNIPNVTNYNSSKDKSDKMATAEIKKQELAKILSQISQRLVLDNQYSSKDNSEYINTKELDQYNSIQKILEILDEGSSRRIRDSSLHIGKHSSKTDDLNSNAVNNSVSTRPINTNQILEIDENKLQVSPVIIIKEIHKKDDNKAEVVPKSATSTMTTSIINKTKTKKLTTTLSSIVTTTKNITSTVTNTSTFVKTKAVTSIQTDVVVSTKTKSVTSTVTINVDLSTESKSATDFEPKNTSEAVVSENQQTVIRIKNLTNFQPDTQSGRNLPEPILETSPPEIFIVKFKDDKEKLPQAQSQLYKTYRKSEVLPTDEDDKIEKQDELAKVIRDFLDKKIQSHKKAIDQNIDTKSVEEIKNKNNLQAQGKPICGNTECNNTAKLSEESLAFLDKNDGSFVEDTASLNNVINILDWPNEFHNSNQSLTDHQEDRRKIHFSKHRPGKYSYMISETRDLEPEKIDHEKYIDTLKKIKQEIIELLKDGKITKDDLNELFNLILIYRSENNHPQPILDNKIAKSKQSKSFTDTQTSKNKNNRSDNLRVRSIKADLYDMHRSSLSEPFEPTSTLVQEGKGYGDNSIYEEDQTESTEEDESYENSKETAEAFTDAASNIIDLEDNKTRTSFEISSSVAPNFTISPSIKSDKYTKQLGNQVLRVVTIISTDIISPVNSIKTEMSSKPNSTSTTNELSNRQIESDKKLEPDKPKQQTLAIFNKNTVHSAISSSCEYNDDKSTIDKQIDHTVSIPDITTSVDNITECTIKDKDSTVSTLKLNSIYFDSSSYETRSNASSFTQIPTDDFTKSEYYTSKASTGYEFSTNSTTIHTLSSIITPSNSLEKNPERSVNINPNKITVAPASSKILEQTNENPSASVYTTSANSFLSLDPYKGGRSISASQTYKNESTGEFKKPKVITHTIEMNSKIDTSPMLSSQTKSEVLTQKTVTSKVPYAITITETQTSTAAPVIITKFVKDTANSLTTSEKSKTLTSSNIFTNSSKLVYSSIEPQATISIVQPSLILPSTKAYNFDVQKDFIETTDKVNSESKAISRSTVPVSVLNSQNNKVPVGLVVKPAKIYRRSGSKSQKKGKIFYTRAGGSKIKSKDSGDLIYYTHLRPLIDESKKPFVIIGKDLTENGKHVRFLVRKAGHTRHLDNHRRIEDPRRLRKKIDRHETVDLSDNSNKAKEDNLNLNQRRSVEHKTNLTIPKEVIKIKLKKKNPKQTSNNIENSIVKDNSQHNESLASFIDKSQQVESHTLAVEEYDKGEDNASFRSVKDNSTRTVPIYHTIESSSMRSQNNGNSTEPSITNDDLSSYKIPEPIAPENTQTEKLDQSFNLEAKTIDMSGPTKTIGNDVIEIIQQ